jgi:glycosyl transferase family 87
MAKEDATMSLSRRDAWGRLSLLQRFALISVSLAALVTVIWLLASYWPDAVDYHYTFYPVSKLWLAGKTPLYDQASAGFFHPPWVIWVYSLFALWPYDVGRALLWVASVAMLVMGILVFNSRKRIRPWLLVVALVNFHTFDLLYRGQIEAFTVLGVVLAWQAYKHRRPVLLGLGYVLLAMTPPNSIPVALFFVWLTWSEWARREWGISLIPPFLMMAISLILHGLWPLRWFSFMVTTTQPLNSGPGWWMVTIWRAASQLNVSMVIPWFIVLITLAVVIWAWQQSGDHTQSQQHLDQMLLVISATFVITSYSLSYRLMLLVAVVIPCLASWRPDVAGGLYILTLLPLLRIVVGTENSWIDIGFVIAVFVAVVVYVTRLQIIKEMAGLTKENS